VLSNTIQKFWLGQSFVPDLPFPHLADYRRNQKRLARNIGEAFFVACVLG
jgi:hypothetical protein